jgi:hypothetical protein
MRPHELTEPTDEALPPMSFVAGATRTPDSLLYPEEYRGQIVVDVIHDGASLPAAFRVDARGRTIPPEVWGPHYHTERDWGANLVAERLAARLGLPGFYTVNTARCLLDFGRFPGTTQAGATHLRRFAINLPFSELLSKRQTRAVLEEHYDRISDTMESAIRGRLIKIAIHTYDQHNKSGTERPHVSLVSRPLGYQNDSQMPHGVFDPLYPDILAEFTIDRILGDRISLTLEKAGVPVAHNYPYLLPEGSTEIRHQVWAFFDWLHYRFEAEHPETEGDEAYHLVWQMLKDTNLRSAEAEALRSFLHMFRNAPPGQASLYEAAEEAYHNIAAFLHADDNAAVREFRFSTERPMSFGVEVRKDLLWRFDKQGRPAELDPERALYVAEHLALAIATYLREDRRPDRQAREGFVRGHASRWVADLDATK